MDVETPSVGVEVFRGSPTASLEFGLVLDAKGMAYERLEHEGAWVLWVEAALAPRAAEELRRYAVERVPPRPPEASFLAFAGSGIGAIGYAVLLILVAYCAGRQVFDVDWLAAGAIESGRAILTDWWRPLTALTLHLDQEHLMGNLLFGVGIGILAGRSVGPGVAWLAILLAGAFANALDMMISPPWHRAVGASTAVFAALGLLTGLTWSRQSARRDRRLYRWAPLFGGGCLLVLLGAGGEHVDVLGHVLGFAAGVATGAICARLRWPRSRGAGLQRVAGAFTVALIAAAWICALGHAL